MSKGKAFDVAQARAEMRAACKELEGVRDRLRLTGRRLNRLPAVREMDRRQKAGEDVMGLGDWLAEGCRMAAEDDLDHVIDHLSDDLRQTERSIAAMNRKNKKEEEARQKRSAA